MGSIKRADLKGDVHNPIGIDQRKETAINSPRSYPPVRLLVVDDHGIVRKGLSLLLEEDGAMQVVASVATGEEAVLAAQRLTPDVIIMDLMLPTLNGIDATRCIVAQCPHVRVIALSACHTLEQVHRALNAGARGYVLKTGIGEEIIFAVHEVMAGRRYVSPSMAELLAHGAPGATIPRSPLECLSHREREILRFVAEGLTSSDIALHLSLSRKTVDTYRSRMMVKLGVTNRAALIRIALTCELPVA